MHAAPSKDTRSWPAKPMPEIHEGQLYGISLLEGITVSLDQDGKELYVRIRESDGKKHTWHLNSNENPGPLELKSGDYVVAVRASPYSLSMEVRKPGWSGSLERAFYNEPIYKLSFSFNSNVRPANGTNAVSVSIGSTIGSIFHSEINTRPSTGTETCA